MLFFEIALASNLGQKDGYSIKPRQVFIGVDTFTINRGKKEPKSMRENVLIDGSGRLFYSVPEVCAMLHVERKTVYRLIDRELLKVSNAIRHKRICSRSLTKFVENTVYNGGAQ